MKNSSPQLSHRKMPISRKPAAFSRVWPFFIASARHFMSITLPRSVRPDACGKHNFTHRQTELDTKGALKTFRSISLPRRDDAPLQPIATPVSKDAPFAPTGNNYGDLLAFLYSSPQPLK